MQLSALKTTTEVILPLRQLFLHEAQFQFVYDSFHGRGWADPYLLQYNGTTVGYGALCEGDAGRNIIFEFYIVPAYRHLSNRLFQLLIETSGAKYVECQTNDHLLSSMLYQYTEGIKAEKTLFKDHVTTRHQQPGVIFRQQRDTDKFFEHKVEPEGNFVLELDGEIVGTGGILGHYNPPYGDLYMEIREDQRRKGLGTFIIQEMKRICYEFQHVPAARCDIGNHSSRGTLEKAGMRICGFIVKGTIMR